MHTPRAFRVDESNTLSAFMQRYSFCTLITAHGDELDISHVPLLVDQRDERFVLTGHLAGVNPHCAKLGGRASTAIFHGPHSYVSPAWYAETAAVPTWNYSSVHATGPVRTFRDTESLSVLVERMIDVYETAHGKPWDRKLPADYRRSQLAHIVGFEMTVENIVGKYKLGQNRSRSDQDAMLAHLEKSSDEDSRSFGRFIRRYRQQD